ncbi:Cof-like hydrolase [Evansella cellulosilytica DSM 2522]|uniref:Cof-like hydrolase n=1 Tax=Evansella cellulosilytica (strain ATCC 21833 / DSM 2522 / FERM P-1141 / JCM 9156 / N-4) TaxID=649639 RepID=E6TUG1_EVAC2|nr:Cof-type HAD-IIB family hydrolase [Evansella cellulosilytica]ADU29717.1 Cof-like hydrolase [Evansella cellulosilytica DSM 2522]
MTFRLLALDIDGTLLKSNHRLAKETKEAVEYAKEKGAYVTLATGRAFPSAKKVAKALKLDDAYLVTHDGAFVASEVDDPIYERRLDSDRVYQIVDILENYHCHIRLLHEKYAIGNKTRQRNLMSRMNLSVGDPLFYPVNFVDSPSHHLIDQPLTVPKIRAQFWSEKERKDALEELREVVRNTHITSSAEGSLDIVDASASKAKGLQILGRKLGISLQEMVAIGSSENDIEMIEQVGLGVAMGQSEKGIQSIADWVTRSNNQNGVGYAVREVFRKQLHPEIYK